MNENKDNISDLDLEYNLILLGDSSVGKNCLFKKLTSGIFKEKNVSTIGIDRRTFELKCELKDKDGTISSKIVKILFIDTAGQERYKALTKSYYKNSDGALLLYDITDEQTFENIDIWINNINESINTEKSEYSIFLIGTKIDLVCSGKKERKVEEKDALLKCEKNGLYWGGEISIKEFPEEKLKEIIAGFISIIYEKKGYKKVNQQNVEITKYISKKKRSKKKFC